MPESNPIRRARHRAGLTMEQLSHKAGVTWRTLMRWEYGKSEPGGRNLVKLAEILGVPERDLLPPVPEVNTPAPSGEAA